jgi:FMN phosphatase YigB (HAD superfamily)
MLARRFCRPSVIGVPLVIAARMSATLLSNTSRFFRTVRWFSEGVTLGEPLSCSMVCNPQDRIFWIMKRRPAASQEPNLPLRGSSSELPESQRKVTGIAFDLYGTLVFAPTPFAFRRNFRTPCQNLSEKLVYRLATGFPGVLIAQEMGVNLASAAVLNLTHRFASASHLANGLRAKFPDAVKPRRQTLRLVDDITQFAVEGTRLAPCARLLLTALTTRGVRLQLISDVSFPFSNVIERLDLRRWFPQPVLSCTTGRLKRNGTAFRALPFAQRKHWIMVGDDWRSDVVGSLTAGLRAIFVDRSRCHPGRFFVYNFQQFLSKSPNHAGIRIADGFRRLLRPLLPISIRVLETDPAEHLELTEDGKIRLTKLNLVRVVDSLGSLLKSVEDVV